MQLQRLLLLIILKRLHKITSTPSEIEKVKELMKNKKNG